jgi:phage terminase large subunit GpA-like protein
MPPPLLTVSQWADRYRRLSGESSALPGRWRTSLAEFQRGIMDAVSDPSVRETVCMKASQIGWTEILNNVIGFHVHQDSSPILMLQPDLNIAETWSKDRFSPMVRDTPVLRRLIADPKARDSGNTILHKRFPGGHLTAVGANSPASLRSRPIRVLLCDEIDGFPPSAGPEGDPIDLARRRTATFRNRRILMGSTPTIKGISRIEKAFDGSDQRYFFVPCPHCDEFQQLLWRQVHWSPRPPSEANYYCVHCGALIEEVAKAAMLERGEWRATKPFTGIAGFHVSELYSPFVTWREMAVAFAAAEKFPETLKTWVNTALGEPWDLDRNAKDPALLRNRAEDYELGTAPAGVLLLTMAVDVQGDRLEAYTWGYGEGEEAWVVDFRAFYGDPEKPVVWDMLLEHLDRPIQFELGGEVVARTVAIDSGGTHTHVVYQFCRLNAIRRTPFGNQQVIAIKGQARSGAPIMGKPTAQDIDLKGDKIAKGVKLWPVGSSAAKHLIYQRLNIDVPGVGFIHTTKALPDEFWDQLIAERLVTKYTRGYPTLEWQLPSGRRNEALDCAVYAYAAACQLQMQRMRPVDWARLRERMTRPVTPAAPAAPVAPPNPQSAMQAPSRVQSMRPKGNWITGWR